MLKFNEVKKALWDQKGLWLTRNVDARHKGKYTYSHTVGGFGVGISYNTLAEVVSEFNLKI